jgi:hypothetical protein
MRSALAPPASAPIVSVSADGARNQALGGGQASPHLSNGRLLAAVTLDEPARAQTHKLGFAHGFWSCAGSNYASDAGLTSARYAKWVTA